MDTSYIIQSLVLGSVIGLTMGMLGGGGAVLAVTALVYIFHESTSVAASTSLAIVGAGSIVGAAIHAVSKDVRIKIGIIVGLSSVAGAFPGAWLNHLVSDKILLLLFGILVVLIGADMLRASYSGKISVADIEVHEAYTRAEWLRLVALGLVVGLLAGFFGVSGGFLIVPALLLVAGITPRQAVGTTLFITIITSTSGFLSHLHFGHVDFKLAGLFVAGGFVGVIIGTLLSDRIPGKTLTRVFAVFIILLAVYIIYRNI